MQSIFYILNNERGKRMNLLEELKNIGVDVEEGLNRMMGNEALYQKMLVSLAKMLQDFFDNHAALRNDIPALTEEVHKIKGASGNLSVTPLYDTYSEILKSLRDDNPEQAKAIFEKSLPIQNQFLACINKYTEA